MRSILAVGTVLRVVWLLGGSLVVAGVLWLTVRLLSRMTRPQRDSPVGQEPTDRLDDDEHQVY